MNASAVLIFLFSPDLHWHEAVATSIGAIIGACSALARCITSTKIAAGHSGDDRRRVEIGLFYKAP